VGTREAGAWTRFGREAAVVGFFLLLAALATRPLVLDLGRRTLAGPDPLIDLWTVHWLTSHALRPDKLFGGNIFYPEPHAVLFSDLSLGTAVLVAPLRPWVRDPVPLYNLALLAALAFAGWAFHVLVRGRTGSTWAGLLSGTLAAFGSHQLSHVYHLNLLSTGWLALLLHALHGLVERPGWRPAVLAGASFALAALSSGYYAVAATLLALCFAAAHVPALGRRRVLAACAGAALLAAALAAPYARAFLELRRREALRRPPGMSASMAFDPRRDLTSHGLLYGRVLGSGGERLFPGLLCLVLAGAAVVRRRRGAAFYAAATGVLLLVALGPRLRLGGVELPLPYAWLFAIPPLDSMRHPYTFAAVATFTLAVLAGLGWPALRAAARPWAGPLIVAVAVVETLAPAPRLAPYPQGLPPAYQALEELPPGPILEVPVFEPETLLWAARHGRPTVNGIGAFAPSETMVLERWVRNHWVRRTPADLDASAPVWLLGRTFRPRYLIVPAGRKPALRPLAAAFESSRVFERVAELPDGDRIYELHAERLPPAGPGEAGDDAETRDDGRLAPVVPPKLQLAYTSSS